MGGCTLVEGATVVASTLVFETCAAGHRDRDRENENENENEIERETERDRDRQR